MLFLYDTCMLGGINADVSAPPSGELFSETNNLEAILLTYSLHPPSRSRRCEGEVHS
jgi:hypothetical protein